MRVERASRVCREPDDGVRPAQARNRLSPERHEPKMESRSNSAPALNIPFYPISPEMVRSCIWSTQACHAWPRATRRWAGVNVVDRSIEKQPNAGPDSVDRVLISAVDHHT